MSSENVAPPNNLIAAVLSTGVSLGIVPREAVVAWADYLIERSEAAPPTWLIDLSLSQNFHPLDILSVLSRLASGADRVAVCRALYAFLEMPASPTFESAQAFAKQVYEFTRECLGADWKYPLLCEADQVADAFRFIREGYLKKSPQRAIGDVKEFLEVNRDCRVKALLDQCLRQPEDPSKEGP